MVTLQDFEMLTSAAIRIILTIGGIVAVASIIFHAFQFITASNPDNHRSAMIGIQSTVVSLVIIIGTFAAFDLIDTIFNVFTFEQINTEFLWGGLTFGFVGVALILLLYIGLSSQPSVRKIKEQYPTLSIVGIISRKRSQQKMKVLLLLSLGLFVYVGFSYFTSSISIGIMIFFLFIMLSIIVKQQVFKYRIYKGFYGNNKREAREIIEFLLNHRDKVDFDDKGKPKRLITETDMKELTKSALDSMPDTVTN